MAAVFIMLAAVVTGINVWNYHATAKRADQRIQEIFDFEVGKGNMSETASPEPDPPEIFDRPDARDPEAPLYYPLLYCPVG